MDDVVIKVENVYKDFILMHEKSNTVKGVFTSMFRKATIKKETQHALKDISFQIKKGEFFGIVGRNGSGKSTLLKILAGIYQPTKGYTSTTGKLVPFIELGVGFNPELSGKDNVYLNGAILGFSVKEVDAMYKSIVEFAELERFMDQKLKNYSSGMQVRLAFSTAIRANADILLIDEVLAVGDADFQRKCFTYFSALKKQKTTVVFVSHDMNAVREFCDRAVLIENSELIAEDTAMKIATKYVRMFEEEDDKREKGKLEGRWGNGTIKFSSINLSPNNLKKSDKYIKIDIKARAEKNISNAIVGFLIKGPSGVPIMGTNTKLKQQTVRNIKIGEGIDISWEVPNIFADGKYFIDIAIEDEELKVASDWWEEAATFKVYNDEKTPYVVNPRVGLSIKRGQNDN